MELDVRWLWIAIASTLIGCSEELRSRRVEDCIPSAEERASTHPRAAALQSLLTEAIRAGLPGALMAVQEGDRAWYGAAGVPDLSEPNRPFQVCHLMPIKSITKSFVAVRVMQLVQDGQLTLEARLDSLLPDELLSGLPNTERITVRHLLNHTSGLRHYPEVVSYVADFLNQPEKAQSRAKALDAVRDLEPYFEPGAGYHYSNTNTLLLQHILEHDRGRRLGLELEEAIWEPLGLDRSHLHQDEPLSDHVAVGYMDLYGNGDAHRIDNLDDVASAAGGMESTLEDLVRFSRGLFEEGTLLDAESLQQLTTLTEVDEAKWDYDAVGLGIKQWHTPLGKVFGSTGEDTGYKAYWHYAPALGLTWILLLNSNYGLFEERASRLRLDALELLAEPERQPTMR